MSQDSEMPPSVEQVVQDFRERGAVGVKLGLTDMDGVIRGKYVSLEKFAGLFDGVGGFCDCVFGWDVNDQLYDTSVYTGWHTGFPDTGYRLITQSLRWLEDENTPYFIAEFVNRDGSAHPLCPRTQLAGVLGQFADSGLQVISGFEYEFFVFDETPHSVREKNYAGMKPLTPGNFGYSVLRNSSEGDLFAGLMDYCARLDLPLEGLHCETGPGVWEAALAPVDGLTAADRANLFKTFSKVFFQKMELLATFMAKWSMDYPGQSGHFHFSIQQLATDENVFFDASAQDGISTLQRHAVGGLQRYLPELLSMLAPTINSYTRLVKGAWAPTAATWGVENRTCAIRVIPGSAKSQRIECRVGGADANPYLCAAATLGAAWLGIQENLEPTAPVQGNAYDVEDTLPQELRFAADLATASNNLRVSSAARRLFGDDFVEHFAMSRDWEVAEYTRHVNSWQLDRYMEII